jgi:hypothetical protein
MSKEQQSNVIHLLWSGPHKVDSFKTNSTIDNNKGVYQIYGTHPIYGRNVLLYIGKTNDNFINRISAHDDVWIKYEYDEVTIYTGTVVDEYGEGVESEEDEKTLIDRAEQLLLYYCAPAYNSNGIQKLKITEDRRLLNYGKIGSLPTEVSTLWEKSKVWEKFK